MARRPDTRLRIERAALALFAARGVDATTTRDIAARVGISEGAIYRHFTGKGDLVWHLFSTSYGDLARHLDAILAESPDLDRRIERAVELFCGMFDRDRDLFTFILLSQHGQLRKLEPGQANPMDGLRRMFQEAIDRNQCAGDDADLLAAVALGMVLQPATFIIYGRIDRTMTALAPSLAKAVKRAVAA